MSSVTKVYALHLPTVRRIGSRIVRPSLVYKMIEISKKVRVSGLWRTSVKSHVVDAILAMATDNRNIESSHFQTPC
jgi:hypothetical protein